MKTDCRISRMSWTCVALLVLVFSLPALAALGGDAQLGSTRQGADEGNAEDHASGGLHSP